MMNKKADFTMKEFIGILLAIIGLLAVAYMAYRLYFVTTLQEEDNAKSMADLIEGKINILEANQTGRFLMRAINGNGQWGIVGWNYTDLDRPDKCFFESCICVCSGIYDYTLSSVKREACQTKGFCRNFGKYNVGVYTFYSKTDYPSPFSDEFVQKFVPGTGERVTNEIRISSVKGVGDLREINIYKGNVSIIVSYSSTVPYQPSS